MNLAPRVSSQAGFTLLEVLITVVIVGILAAIALPSYSDYITRSKIIDGTTKLGDFRAQMEKYYLDFRTYQPNPAAGTACGIPNPTVGGGDAFQITCEAPTASTYTITASGLASKGMNGFNYTVNQTGLKQTGGTSWGATSANCWVLRKDGSCQ